MDWLTIIAKDHNKWIAFVKGFGEIELSEDIVQDMYIKLHKMDVAVRDSKDKRFAKDYCTASRVLKDGKPNASYIWMVLNSIFIDYQKEKAKTIKISLEDVNLIAEDYNSEKDLFIEKLEDEKKSWHTYDKLLFDIYSTKDLSMRDIADGAGIGLRTIWNDLNNIKQRIRKLEKEYKIAQHD